MKKEISQAEVNIGLIGHVDHGKTSLTHALSGKWTDTHSEELKRGISIRLGYADAVFYKCPACKGAEAYTTQETCSHCKKKTKRLRKVSFVDAPGHETLMTTMISGAALMHGAILVIAANEFCPQPRTKEHLMALKVSGIKNIIVAQNKIDLVDKKQATENYHQIKKFLKEFDFEAEIIPTAAHFGTNIDLLIETIEKKIPSPKIDEKKPVKMYVARSFDINKPGIKIKELIGGALGGTIMQGKIKTGDELELSPGINNKKNKVKIIEINTSEGKIKEAVPGGLISIRTLIDSNLTKNDQMKGNILGKIGSLPEAVTNIKMKIKYFQREVTGIKTDLKQGEIIVLSAGTATTIGNIIALKKDLIEVMLKVPITIEPNQKIAISKKEGARWRLIAYGTTE